MLLAIETATDVCSVVFKNRKGEEFEKRSETKGSHSENLFLFVDELMKEYSFGINDLNGVLVSEGPGSYTGLRIAASAVKGLLFGSEVPLYGMNTLASFVMAAVHAVPSVSLETLEASNIHSVIDARRKHLYHQSFLFKNGKLKGADAIAIRSIEEVEQMIQAGDIVIGTGLNRLDASVSDKAVLMDKKLISAGSLIRLFEQSKINQFYRKVAPADFSPKYYNTKAPQVRST